VIDRRQAEAAFDPALQHSALRVVRVITPAAQQVEITGDLAEAFGGRVVVGGRAKVELQGHVMLKDFRRFRLTGATVEQAKQAGMCLAGAMNTQGTRMRVERRRTRQPYRQADQIRAVPAFGVGVIVR
jgi:hypothetical protein